MVKSQQLYILRNIFFPFLIDLYFMMCLCFPLKCKEKCKFYETKTYTVWI